VPNLHLDGPIGNHLVVEGSDDFHTLANLFDIFKYKGRCRVSVGGGYTQLLERLNTHVREIGLERYGIVVDADEDMENRWWSIKLRLLDIGYATTPNRPDPAGTIITAPDQPTMGVWIMPDNTLPGALEDFARQLIPDNDRLWPRADTVVDDIPADQRLFPAVSLMKAKLHTWLAWQNEPGKPIGQAITKRYLDPGSSTCLVFKNWLERLFDMT
jgi:hypothetical protein